MVTMDYEPPPKEGGGKGGRGGKTKGGRGKGKHKKAVTAGDVAVFAVGEDGSLSRRQGVKVVSVVGFVCVCGGGVLLCGCVWWCHVVSMSWWFVLNALRCMCV